METLQWRKHAKCEETNAMNASLLKKHDGVVGRSASGCGVNAEGWEV